MAGPDQAGQRVDRAVADWLPETSRARLTRALKAGEIQVNDAPARPAWPLAIGDRVRVPQAEVPALSLTPEPVEFTVVYADEHLVVIDKPAGLVVHPGAGHATGTLVHGLLHRFGQLSPIGAPERPGIVHRIDAGTSGLLVVARDEATHHHLARQFAAHSVSRRYLALAWDRDLGDAGTCRTAYGRHPHDRRKFTGDAREGRHAVTHWRVIQRVRPCALVRLRLETGRTHQIRVHLAEMGSALVGDPLYGSKRRIEQPPVMRHLGFELGLRRQFLHAEHLGFEHPADGTWRFFNSPLPDDLRRALLAIGGALPEVEDAEAPTPVEAGPA